MVKRVCYSCGATDGEAQFPERKPRGKRRMCCDCLASAEQPVGEKIVRPFWVTRAAWRAQERARQKSEQMDLVDWLASVPAQGGERDNA